jgi:homocitrate synthase
MQNRFIDFIDTTLRDGQQSPLLFDTKKYRFNLQDKIQIAESLIAIGISHFELFSPVVNKHEAIENSKLMNHIRAKFTQRKIMFLAHCRLHEDDIRMSLDADFDGLNIYIGTSENSKNHSHKMALDDIIRLAKDILASIRRRYPSLYIRLSAEDAFRTPIGDIFKLYDAIKDLVFTLGAPDTVGVADPDTVKNIVGALAKRYPRHAIECHFHNDRGLSVANTISAFKNGASYFDTSVWGIAERSGITSTTAALFNLVQYDKNLKTRYSFGQSYSVNAIMGSILKCQVPYSEPVSLTNRTHTAGVHQKAVISNPEVYEAHSLTSWGVDSNAMLLGPLSGWNLIYYYLHEVGNYELNIEDSKAIAKNFKNNIHKISKKNKPQSLLYQIANDYGLIKKKLPKMIATRRIEKI